MSRFKRSDDPNQGLLLPPSPKDWLPEGHLAWFILETVDKLDIEKLATAYRHCGKGELPYPPRVMLRLLIHAYVTGTFSSRRIAAQIDENIAFRVLAGGHRPSHRTICRFREEHLAEFHDLFTQVVQIGKEAGVVKMGVIAVDGTKVKANASKHKAMSHDRMLVEEAKLREEIAKLTRAAKSQDAIDDASFGPDFRGDELPKELSRRETRLATITAAKNRLEERKAREAQEAKEAQEAPQSDLAEPAPEKPTTPRPKTKAKSPTPKPRDQENFTDPDSRIMPTGGNSFGQSYNAQIAVDSKSQMIVGTMVTQSPNDCGHLVPTLNAAIKCTNQVPKRVIADAGYKSESNLQTLSEMKIDAYVSLGREGKSPSKSKKEQPHTAAMRRKLATKRGRKRYRTRKCIVEPVFGWVKHVLGFRAFSLRGLRKVAGEWNLVCLALNLRRMAAIGVAR